MPIDYNIGTPDVYIGVITFNGRDGIVTLLSSDVVSALGYNPADGTYYLPGTSVGSAAARWIGSNFGTGTFINSPTGSSTVIGVNNIAKLTIQNALISAAANMSILPDSGNGRLTIRSNPGTVDPTLFFTDGTITSYIDGNLTQGFLFNSGPGDFFFRNALDTVLFKIDNAGIITIPVTPATSGGGFDILTRNTSTGAIEKTSISGVTVTSFNTRSGAVTLLSSDVTGALGYTPANIAGDTFTGPVTVQANGFYIQCSGAFGSIRFRNVGNLSGFDQYLRSTQTALTANQNIDLPAIESLLPGIVARGDYNNVTATRSLLSFNAPLTGLYKIDITAISNVIATGVNTIEISWTDRVGVVRTLTSTIGTVSTSNLSISTNIQPGASTTIITQISVGGTCDVDIKVRFNYMG